MGRRKWTVEMCEERIYDGRAQGEMGSRQALVNAFTAIRARELCDRDLMRLNCCR